MSDTVRKQEAVSGRGPKGGKLRSKHGDPLTEAQALVLRFICNHILRVGYPPTIREIMSGLGFSSTNAVSEHLAWIEKKGNLHRVRGCSARGIVVFIDADGRSWSTAMLNHNTWPNELTTTRGMVLKKIRVDMRGLR